MIKDLMFTSLLLSLLMAGVVYAEDVKIGSDQEFVNQAAICGMTEVKLGQLATTNGASKEVKDLGAMIVTDHTKVNTELKGLAAKKNWQLPANLDEKHQMTVDKFSKLTGAEFDREYIMEMKNDHQKDLAMFRAGSKGLSDPDLKAWVGEKVPTLEMHLKHIESMAK